MINKLNYTLILLLIITISLSYTYSQSTLIIGDAGVNEYTYAVSRDQEGNSYLGGVSNQSGLITKVNSIGDITWSKKFGLNLSTNQKIDIAFLDILSDTLFGCGWISSGTTIQGTIYFKMNKNTGGFYWMKSEVNSGMYYSTMRYDSGKYFLIGSKTTSNSSYDGKLLCVNSQNGNILWQNGTWGVTFPSSNIDFIDNFNGMSSIQNGKFFITGRSYVSGPGNNMRVTLMGFDLAGNIICNKFLLYPESHPGINRFYGVNIEFDGPDSLVIVFFGDDNCSGSCDFFKVGLTKVDLNGTVSFSKTYDISSSPREYVKSLNITNDAYVFFGGVDYSASNSKLFAIKTNKSGVFQTARLISKTGSALPILMGSANIAGNSGFTNSTHSFAASIHNGNTNDRDMVLIQMDGNLNSNNPCFLFESIQVVTENIPPFSSSLNMVNKPNTLSYTSGVVDEDNLFNTIDCTPNDIIYQESLFGCDSSVIHVSSASGIIYTINWDNGSIGNTSTFYTDTSSILEFYNPVKCCFFSDTVQVSIGNQIPDVLLQNDTSLCILAGSTFDIIPITTNCTTCDYLWNDASTDSLLSINTTGWYSVTITNSCGSQDSDSIYIVINYNPQLSLINDTLVCPNNFPINITTSASYIDSIVWSNGTNGFTSNYTNSGIGYVEVYSICGNNVDSFLIDTIPTVYISEINNIDTCLYLGQSLEIPILGTNFNSLLVNGINYNVPTITATTDSSYTIIASNNCSQDSIQFSVIINEYASYFGKSTVDTCLASGNPVDIMVNVTNGTLTWWNGSQIENQTVTNSGIYYYTVSNNCGSVNDSIVVSYDSQPQGVLIDIDTCINADGGFYLTNPTATQGLTWNLNGNDSLYVTQSGIYYAIIGTACGTITDSAIVTINYFPFLSVSDTIHVCADYININNLGVDSNYPITVSTPTGLNIGNLISEEGNYIINSSSICGSISQPLYIVFDSDIRLYAPNSFTPDGNEFNNRYEFKGENYRILEVTIYNRWGEKIYNQLDGFDGWDGTYNNHECQSGTYTVIVKYTSCSQIAQELYLHLNLLR